MPNLVGIGNSQVPTNAMLGGLAYQDSVGDIDIEKIKAKMSDDATDIFVYDTSKDSDGGAWRKKATTQSWYNENPSATRGARKEFPAVAVIVAEQNPAYKVTIYDGDDPNLSMWMQWIYVTNDPFLDYSTPGSHHLGNYAPLSLSAMNGIVCVGTYRSAGSISNLNAGLREFNFIEDTCYATNNDKRVKFPTRISERNIVITGYYEYGNQKIVDSNVRDVAMTVLPNAPVSKSSGLPRPTIAVATDGGTSIIKDFIKNETDGSFSIVDIVYSGSPNTRYVNFRESDNAIVMSMDSNASYVHVIYDIPITDISGSHQYQKEAIDDEFYRTGSSQNWGQDLWISGLSPFGDSVRIAGDVIAGNSGLNILSPNRESSSNTMVAYVRSSSNSGYMHGDNIGAYMSSTDTTDLVASSLQMITNGTFDSDSNWTKDGSWTISGGTATNSGSGNINQTISVVTGKRYLMSATMDFTGDSSLGNTTIGFRNTANSSYYAHVNMHSEGTANAVNYFQLYWTSTVTGNVIARCYSVDGVSIDNWSVQPVDGGNADRSRYNEGLKVFGTVNVSSVASGADLVAYSGFSNSNFLQLPRGNSKYQFGTGDWAFYGWYNDDGGSGARTIFEVARNEVAGDHIGMRHDGNNLELFISDDGFSSQDVAEFYQRVADAWQFTCGVRRGNRIEIWSNGELKASTLITNATGNLGESSSFLRFGNRTYTNQPWDGKLALWRVSKSAPSPEQIRKIYDEEKPLFNEHAKCTLHGTSDAITGLAFDDSHDILHVGTSAGRSEFQGLTRINNTTTAVTTAISASNKFVAEQ